jgi:hypothetical protein
MIIRNKRYGRGIGPEQPQYFWTDILAPGGSDVPARPPPVTFVGNIPYTIHNSFQEKNKIQL